MARTSSLSWPIRLRLEQERRRRAAGATSQPGTAPAAPRTAAAMSFSDWLPEVTPGYRWDWPHLVYQRERIERALLALERRLADPDYESDEPTGILIISPPRHGKTEQNTIRLGAYALERNPSWRIMLGCHTQSLANKFSRRIRRIARARGVPLSYDRVAVTEWETAAGGGLRSAGVGTGIAGEGADIFIIDDPIKSRKQAESERFREELWDWFRDDVWNRRNTRHTLVMVTMTTWHQDDLAGRIQADPELSKRFLVIRLPALAEDPTPAGSEEANLYPDPLGRQPGQALCPERMPQEELESIRLIEGEYSFSALFQGRATPRKGNMFPGGRTVLVDRAPAGTIWARGWDKAGTRDTRGKYTAGVKVGIGPDGCTYIEDVRRERLEFAERELEIKTTAQLDGHGVPIRIEQEPGSGGKQSAQSSVVNLAGFQVGIEPSVVNKEARAQPFASQWQAGMVRLVRGPWCAKYVEELRLFPNGQYSDQVDATTIAYNYLTQHAVTFSQVRVRTP